MKTLIRRYQSRWQLLSLSIDPESFWDVFFDHPPTAWINLHTISLYGYDFLAVASERVAQGLDALEKLHSLRCILLEDCEGYEFTRQFGPLDLQTLHINFDVFGTDQAHLIAAYPYLTTLNLVAPPHLRPELSLQDHITLPFLLSLSYNTYGLSLLDHFTTPALAELHIQLNCDPNPYADIILASFLLRCTSALQVFTLNGDSQEAFITKVLPSLSERPDLTQITFDVWPFPNKLSRFQKDSHPCWCPHLQELTVSIRSQAAIELERMADLAAFLKRREELGLVALEGLTVHRCSGAVEFSYELFQDVKVGKLRVMVPVEIGECP
ncbi:hypothetical protein BKA70DRAFT_1235856 [Coprinopsis sp. MPI-PUGE-AT-0042]|nr:hypothetical protein BKA70DRAFT_1235856 [Coprinopsis sp. MPI-PUGE-AT-0042]